MFKQHLEDIARTRSHLNSLISYKCVGLPDLQVWHAYQAIKYLEKAERALRGEKINRLRELMRLG